MILIGRISVSERNSYWRRSCNSEEDASEVQASHFQRVYAVSHNGFYGLEDIIAL